MLTLAARVLLGPLFYLRERPARALVVLAVAVLLTLLTQIGGAVLWVTLPLLEFLGRVTRRFGRGAAWIAPGVGFLAVYALAALVVVPPLAAPYSRQPLRCFGSADQPYAASSMLFCAANRHYASPAVHRLMVRVGREVAARYPGSVVTYLDAGFPFLDGFPLLPHLSHRNGRTVDLAFFYRDAANGRRIQHGGGWPLGYWVFAPSRPGPPQVVRFQGCRAARHDDHAHVRVSQRP